MGSTWVRGFWFGWFYVVNWGLVVWVQGGRREGFGDARFLQRLAIWVMEDDSLGGCFTLVKSL